MREPVATALLLGVTAGVPALDEDACELTADAAAGVRAALPAIALAEPERRRQGACARR